MTPIHQHSHGEKRCPVTGSNGYCPPREGESRSVCPALNTMANHGFIPRDGKHVSIPMVIRGLKACYGLTTVLATFLTVVGFLILGRIMPMNLFEIGLHNRIEHDASLVHEDTPRGEKYAPKLVHPKWVWRLVFDIKPSIPIELSRDDQVLVDATDVARMRIRREMESPPLDGVHAEIARGEMAIILGVWEKTWTLSETSKSKGIPLPWLLDWLENERLPEGWTPDHKTGLVDTIARSKQIREAMEKMKDYRVPSGGAPSA